MCCTVQEFGPLPQARNIRLEVGPSGIVVGDFIQAAYAVNDTCHPTEQDRDKAGHRAENEGRCRRLRHHLRKLTSVRDHAALPPSGMRRLTVPAAPVIETRSSPSYPGSQVPPCSFIAPLKHRFGSNAADRV